jgi:phage baseplate assembly protein V
MDERQSAQQYNNLHRKIAINTMIGTIQEVDVKTATASVLFNQDVINGLRIMAQRAGSNGKSWWLPAKGEQVVVLAPFGDITEGIIIGSIYYGSLQENPNNAIPEQSTHSSEKNYKKYYADGSSTSYDPQNHEFVIDLKNQEQKSGVDVLLNEKKVFSFKQENTLQEIQLNLSDHAKFSIINDENSESVIINSPKKLRITSENIELNAKNIELISKNVNVKKG